MTGSVAAASSRFVSAWDRTLDASPAYAFRPFRPFAPAADRDAWASLPRDLAALYARRAAEHRDRPWPRPLAHDWARFFRDGDRRTYETQYGEMRRRVADDLMAFGVAGPDGERGRTLLEDIIDGVTLICDQSAWQVPAHNAYVRDAPQLPWPDPDRPVLDLFACETGQLLASALYLLGGALPEPIRRRIGRELARRIVTPYLTDRFWWMGEGDGPTNNWTTWCTQNVLATAFLAPFDDATRRRVVTRAAASLDAFVDEYGDDGCCTEGAGYYHSAALCLFGAMRILAEAAPETFAPLWGDAKIANIATYIARVRIGENLYLNFSDCSIHAGLMGIREYLFARMVGDGEMARTAATEWAHALELESGASAGGSGTGLDPMARIGALNPMLEAGAARDMLRLAEDGDGQDDRAGCAGHGESAGCAGSAGRAAAEPPETYFPSTGIAVLRGGGFAVGVKAGRNGFSHSHNDTGSVIVWRDGAPVLIDPGVETYTRQTFSPRRYDLWTMQSSWHNLPDFDGVMQEATPSCEARDVRVAFGTDRSVVEADLTHAWPAAAGLGSYRRDVTLDKAARTLTIRDDADGTFGLATMHLMTAVEPVRLRGKDADAPSGEHGTSAEAVASAGAVTFRVGEALLAIDRSAETDGCALGDVVVEPKPLDDAKLRGEWKTDRLWRINVPFRGALRVTVR
ncbi:heparinase [Bifidobacterium sp. DSM 109958]|uniref:Heparinase n=1 Tax=Bifidobacterium moraviense TaxID=2675323 RepID=A0A7Y0F387_9BIFI|nr:heparinase II/III family protein [Bifidobacterium sp. DSM 109958]NMN01214.1 heparinase [Bifidobacterium sp. DSM 109958]